MAPGQWARIKAFGPWPDPNPAIDANYGIRSHKGASSELAPVKWASIKTSGPWPDPNSALDATDESKSSRDGPPAQQQQSPIQASTNKSSASEGAPCNSKTSPPSADRSGGAMNYGSKAAAPRNAGQPKTPGSLQAAGRLGMQAPYASKPASRWVRRPEAKRVQPSTGPPSVPSSVAQKPSSSIARPSERRPKTLRGARPGKSDGKLPQPDQSRGNKQAPGTTTVNLMTSTTAAATKPTQTTTTATKPTQVIGAKETQNTATTPPPKAVVEVHGRSTCKQAPHTFRQPESKASKQEKDSSRAGPLAGESPVDTRISPTAGPTNVQGGTATLPGGGRNSKRKSQCKKYNQKKKQSKEAHIHRRAASGEAPSTNGASAPSDVVQTSTSSSAEACTPTATAPDYSDCASSRACATPLLFISGSPVVSAGIAARLQYNEHAAAQKAPASQRLIDVGPTDADEITPSDAVASGAVHAKFMAAAEAEWQEQWAQISWSVTTRDEKAKLRAAHFRRVTNREKALTLQRKLAEQGKCQFAIPLEIMVEIVLKLDHESRNGFALSCRDVHRVVSQLTTIWNVSTGEFAGAEQGGKKTLVHKGRPNTQHAVTVIVEDKEHARKGYMAHELSMLKKMTLSCFNMGDHFRHLEFHRAPLLRTKLLRILVPSLPNLEYLGIFDCDLISVLDTVKLLKIIRTDVRTPKSSRKVRVQLDFFPSISYAACQQVDMKVAMPAFLYTVLPQARAQKARLLDEGTGFPRFLAKCNSRVSERLLRSIERNVQDEYVISRIANMKHKGALTHVDRNSCNAQFYKCRSHDAIMAGCFFPIAQLKLYADEPECWGCRLREELRHNNKDPRSGRPDQVRLANRWFAECGDDLPAVAAVARQDVPVQLSEDKTFNQLWRERADDEEIARHVEKGHLKPGQTLADLKGRHRWSKVRAAKG